MCRVCCPQRLAWGRFLLHLLVLLFLLNVVLFIIGAVAIGLVLLDHSHCSGDKEVEDPHAGHNH